MSENTSQNLTVGAYGQQIVDELTTIFQISAEHGLIGKVFFDSANGGTVTADDLFEIASGVSANGAALALTQRPVPSRAGQGKLCNISAIFSPGVAGNIQTCGFFSSTDALSFAYVGADFGVLRRYLGKDEIQTLTYTVPAAGAENATITVDGVGYTVPLTAGTVEHNAYETAISLNSQTNLFQFSSNGATVVAIQSFASPAAAFAFSSGTAIAAWVLDVAGVAPTIQFNPQSEWAETPTLFDPTVGNEYKIQFNGAFGCVEFFIKDHVTCDYVKVFALKSDGANDPIVGNPSMRAGWTSINAGSTTSVAIKGAGCGIFIEGENKITNSPLSVSNTAINVGAGSDINVLTIRNRSEFGAIRNLSEIKGVILSVGTDSSKGAIFKVVKGAAFSGDLDFQYNSKDQSLLEFATDPVTVTGGASTIGLTLGPSGSGTLTENDLESITLPGGVITITAQMVAAPAATATATLTYKDDL